MCNDANIVRSRSLCFLGLVRRQVCISFGCNVLWFIEAAVSGDMVILFLPVRLLYRSKMRHLERCSCSLILRNGHQNLTFVFKWLKHFLADLAIAQRDFRVLVFWHFHWNMENIQPNNEMKKCKVYCQYLFFFSSDLGSIFFFLTCVNGEFCGSCLRSHSCVLVGLGLNPAKN